MDKKVEREIRELLERMDDFVSEERRLRPLPPRRRTSSGRGLFGVRLLGRVGRWLKGTRALAWPAQCMLLSYALALVAWILRAFSPGLGSLLGLVAAILFLTGYLLIMAGRGRARPEPRWRGQVIDLPRRHFWDDWLIRFYRWRRRR